MKTVLLFLAGCLAALSVQATVYTVTKIADTLDGSCDHDCSLREAITAANAFEDESGADVVVIPAGIYRLARTGAGEDAAASGDLDLTDRMILVGAGAGSTVLDGIGFDRVLDAHASAEIYGVTIRNGRVDGDGGGLLVRPGVASQPVVVHRSIVAANQAQSGGDGGGIAALGFLEVRASAIVGNHADGDGGGVAAGDQGSFSLINVTVSGNLADGSGGGLAVRPDRAGIVSGSTVVLNQAHVAGGGITARLPLAEPSDPWIVGSIVAQNTAPLDADCSSEQAVSRGYNVFGSAGSCGLDPTDRQGTEADPLRVVSTFLVDHLGATPVHVLLAGSPALGFVPDSFCETEDQVGQARSPLCEAGAWESVEHPECVPGGSILCLQGGRFRVTATWSTNPEQPGSPAQALPLSDDTGNFWFFSPANLEILIKVLDGCAVNGRWWVFASGLTDVGVRLEVADLETGSVWSDEHKPGRTYPPRLDTAAFDCGAPLRSAETPDEVPPPGIPGPPTAVLAVTKTADTFDGICDQDCSLRDAVVAANIAPGTSVIVLGPGVHALAIAGAGEDGGGTGDLDIAGQVVILGAGARKTILDGGGLDRVLDVQRKGSLKIHDVTVRNGRALPDSLGEASGGGIRVRGELRLTRSVIESNRADGAGGGIWAVFSRITVRASTISNNESGYFGGGLAAGLADLDNVTISGNRAAEQAGGFFIPIHAARLSHVTITGNSAPVGGGIVVSEPICPILCYGPFVIENSLIAGNIGGDCADLPPHGGEFSLFGIGSGCLPAKSDQAGTLTAPLDPRLTALGDHGGATPTHLPLPDSPAIDAERSNACAVRLDQRGRQRPADGDLDGITGCDAGAVERLPLCQPGEDTLCLGEGDRFRVRARWTALGTSGPGKSLPLTLDTGALWFFDPANVELELKVLDGCGVNGHQWVFVTGLTDVEVEMTVEDTATGATWSHTHAAGTPFQPRLDTAALPCGPL